MGDRDYYKIIKDAFNYIAKAFSWSCFLLLLLIAIFVINYSFEARAYKAKGQKHQPKYSLFTILSGSMEPNIKVDDVIFDIRVDKPEELKVGDVITFVTENPALNNMIITHRIVGIGQNENGYYYHTKGDFNSSEDNATVSFGNIIGKTVFKIPKLGLLQKIIVNRIGWIVLILIPTLSVIVYDSIKVIKTIQLNNKSKIISIQTRKTKIVDTSSLKERLLKKKIANSND